MSTANRRFSVRLLIRTASGVRMDVATIVEAGGADAALSAEIDRACGHIEFSDADIITNIVLSVSPADQPAETVS